MYFSLTRARACSSLLGGLFFWISCAAGRPGGPSIARALALVHRGGPFVFFPLSIPFFHSLCRRSPRLTFSHARSLRTTGGDFVSFLAFFSKLLFLFGAFEFFFRRFDFYFEGSDHFFECFIIFFGEILIFFWRLDFLFRVQEFSFRKKIFFFVDFIFYQLS